MILNWSWEGGYTRILGAVISFRFKRENYPQCKKKGVCFHKLHALNIPGTNLKPSTDDTEQADLRFQVQVEKESGGG